MEYVPYKYLRVVEHRHHDRGRGSCWVTWVWFHHWLRKARQG